ncbi:MAG: nitrous oxide reductase accessory protein NosL [Trueperaceae bacterium]|nr:nitrous oxide reductase accessory protein NosL [Truepera sp.]HRN18186.1 nitrous oxide reductase accessory protein NosL [Trueperaceae bacterium]HRQ09761.1 nitrous oxide reductase accessory protein NosL [Trueperaceae bacterium]
MTSRRGRLSRREFLRRVGAGAAVALLPRALVGAAPRETNYGVDVCPYCNMTIVDLRFTAQVVTPTGLVLNYDAIECLADHLAGHGPVPPLVEEVYVADRQASTREAAVLLPAAEAVLLHHPRLRTPMGGGLAAFTSKEAAEAFATAQRYTGAELLGWAEVLERAAMTPWVPDY